MAIAFDAKSDGTNSGSVTSITWAHTCTGSNRVLIVAARTDNGDLYTLSATYNAITMTEIGRVNMPTRPQEWYYLFYLLAPATGGANVVVTATGTSGLYGSSSSYTGVTQVGPDGSSTNTTSSGTSINCSITTLADNCWTFATGFSMATPGSSHLVASTNTIERTTFASSTPGSFDNNTVITPAGTYTMYWTYSSDANACVIMASFAGGAAAPSIVGGNLSLTGVG